MAPPGRPRDADIDPDWTRSAIDAQLERVVDELRSSGDVAKFVTLEYLRNSWTALVQSVESGYTESVYEYANDVDSRVILDRVCHLAPQAASQQLLVWLRPLDERFDAATVRAVSPIHGTVESALRWHWRIPRKLAGELQDNLNAMGVTAVDH